MYAVLRIRSSFEKSHDQRRTLEQLHLTRVNHCSVLPINGTVDGMIKRVKHLVTWGEIEPMTLSTLLKNRASVDGGLDDALVSEHTEYGTVDEFAEALISGDADFSDIPDLKNLFRLHPPRGGYKGVKKPYKNGGTLGYRGKDINTILEKMLGPEVNKGE